MEMADIRIKWQNQDDKYFSLSPCQACPAASFLCSQPVGPQQPTLQDVTSTINNARLNNWVQGWSYMIQLKFLMFQFCLGNKFDQKAPFDVSRQIYRH